MQSLRPDPLFRCFLSCCPLEGLLLVFLTIGADKLMMYMKAVMYMNYRRHELEIVMSGINKIYTEKEL